MGGGAVVVDGAPWQGGPTGSAAASTAAAVAGIEDARTVAGDLAPDDQEVTLLAELGIGAGGAVVAGWSYVLTGSDGVVHEVVVDAATGDHEIRSGDGAVLVSIDGEVSSRAGGDEEPTGGAPQPRAIFGVGSLATTDDVLTATVAEFATSLGVEADPTSAGPLPTERHFVDLSGLRAEDPDALTEWTSGLGLETTARSAIVSITGTGDGTLVSVEVASSDAEATYRLLGVSDTAPEIAR
ncbi:hypothetical protein [Ilumatobacter sp.]|uniref:hypothetical protein n=1 Tax=Ilumatobacter sp. TaxID=1967498 RepID=UPI003B522623